MQFLLPGHHSVAALVVCAILSACGGGGGAAPADPPPAAVPVDPAPAAAPVITTQPASQSVTEGGSVTFGVAAANATGASYQWLRNGQPVAGATQAAYLLAKAETTDSGSRWSVRISTAAGSSTSNEAILTVFTVPLPIVPKLSLVAGDPGGTGNVDGTGRWARFSGIAGIAVDAAGVIYVADTGNYTLRKVTPDGRVTTLAGTAGQHGIVDGAGAAARFSSITDVTLMPDGALLVANGDRLRRVTVEGVVTTLPTPGLPVANKLAVDSQGVIYIATRSAVWRMAPGSAPVMYAGFEGIETTSDGPGTSARFNFITAMAMAKDGTIYVTQQYDSKVRKISPQGFVDSIRQAGVPLRFNGTGGITVDAAGTPWLANYDNVLSKIGADGSLTTPFTTVEALRAEMPGLYPGAMAFNAAGELVFASIDGVAKFDASGRYSEIAGSVLASKSVVEDAHAMALDGQGGLFLAHAIVSPNTLGITKYSVIGQKLAFGPLGSTVQLGSENLASQRPPVGLGMDASGQLIVGIARVDFSGMPGGGSQVVGGRIRSFSPQGVATMLADWSSGDAGLVSPAHLVTDRLGDAWFIDLKTGSLMRRSAAGALTAAAGSVVQPYRFPGEATAYPIAGATGQVYVSNTGQRTIQRLVDNQLVPFIAAGAAAVPVDGPVSQARFQSPGPGVVDSKGNVYVADGELIRRVSPDGAVTTVAGVPGRLGVTAGELPASLGLVRAMALLSDKALLVLVDRALLRVDLP